MDVDFTAAQDTMALADGAHAGSEIKQAATSTTTNVFTASDGVELTFDYTQAPSVPRHVVIALHSFGDYRAAFSDIAPLWTKHRITTFALDQRGFGQSGKFGAWAGHERMVQDVLEFARFVRSQVGPGTPISLVGESMGGGTAIAAGAKRPQYFDKLILAAPAVRDELPLRWAYDAALAVGETVVPEADKTLSRDDNPLLTPAAQNRLATDPQVVREVSVDMYAGLVDLADAASKAAAEAPQPALLLYGSEDKTIHPKSARAAAKALQMGQFCYLPGAPHLVLQWRDGGAIIEAVAAWLLEPEEAALPCKQAPVLEEQTDD